MKHNTNCSRTICRTLEFDMRTSRADSEYKRKNWEPRSNYRDDQHLYGIIRRKCVIKALPSRNNTVESNWKSLKTKVNTPSWHETTWRSKSDCLKTETKYPQDRWGLNDKMMHRGPRSSRVNVTSINRCRSTHITDARKKARDKVQITSYTGIARPIEVSNWWTGQLYLRSALLSVKRYYCAI